MSNHESPAKIITVSLPDTCNNIQTPPEDKESDLGDSEELIGSQVFDEMPKKEQEAREGDHLNKGKRKLSQMTKQEETSTGDKEEEEDIYAKHF